MLLIRKTRLMENLARYPKMAKELADEYRLEVTERAKRAREEAGE